jgi:2-polyprenyl-6-methoxyphenol hydroxylase-like FAD-dependent oxidoreductase
MRSFLARLRESGRVPASWQGVLHGHAYLTYATAPRPLSGARFALIGDAAGLAYDKSGEGIRPAVESGLLLARALAKARDAADPSALDAYAQVMEQRFGPRSAGRAPTGVRSWEAALAGRLFASRWFARRVVVERWFLNARQPGLAA